MLYKLSRFSPLHNFLRVIMNNILWLLPVSLKFGVGAFVRRFKFPYRLLKNGDVVVQIGAPWDLLRAGRSRAIHFSRCVGAEGKVIVIEPDEENLDALHQFISDQSIKNISVIPKAAWNAESKIRFLTDKKHPASNLVAEVFDEQRTDLEKYDVTDVDADSLDNILSKLNITSVDLLSITSNGSEKKILTGINNTINNVKYISVIGDKNDYEILNNYGFEMMREDDRGFLFSQAA